MAELRPGGFDRKDGGTSVGSIRRVLASRDALEQAAHKLVELALRGEASDNISAIVLAVEGGRVRAAKARRPSRTKRVGLVPLDRGRRAVDLRMQ